MQTFLHSQPLSHIAVCTDTCLSDSTDNASNFTDMRSRQATETMLHLKKAGLSFFLCLLMVGALAQTYSTKANGNWSDPATWSNGLVPPTEMLSTMVVNVRHEVNFNISNDLNINGTLNITGNTLRFPSTFSKKITVYTMGTLRVLNGTLIQDIPSNRSDLIVNGGKLLLENATVHISKNFKSSNGAKRTIRNSLLKIGEGYEMDGTTLLTCKDTIQYSTVEINLSHDGAFELKDNSQLFVANAKLYVNSSDFKTNTQSSINVLSNAASKYGFDILKVAKNLDVDGKWNALIYSYCVDQDIKGNNFADIDFVRAEDCTLPAPPPAAAPKAQLVLNEIYPDPGIGNHEFFELYNSGTTPESLNSYALVSFFSTAVEKGFFVLDFPDLVVEPKSYFVATSSFPFNYQSITNSLSANMNWNNLVNLAGGALTKWVMTNPTGDDGNSAIDNNPHYNKAILPVTGLFDLLNRNNIDGTFTFFLYKNGVLVNQVLMGSGGQNSLSSALLAMPPLNISMADATSPNFSINFAQYQNLAIENVVAQSGTDNGFARSVDGGCGSWKKASSSSQQTPMASNGGMSVGGSGDVKVNSYIVKGTATTGSMLHLSVSSTNATVFPVQLRIYADNGSVQGQYDVNDTYIDTKTATQSGQSFTVPFQPFDADVLIQTQQASGCTDQMQMSMQTSNATLPVRFVNFSATYAEPSVTLNWSTAEESEIQHYIVQKSLDGKTFTDIGYVFPGDKTAENYSFKDKNVTLTTTLYYRIKAASYSTKEQYTAIRVIKAGSQDDSKINVTVYPNPVKDQMQVLLPAQWKGKSVTFEIYSVNGALMQRQVVVNSTQSIAIDVAILPKGMYLLKTSCENSSIQQRIIKH